MGFLNDLKEGEDYEKFVQSKLSEVLNIEVEKNEVKTDTDLVGNDLRIEVKFDRQMRGTWNVFIEYACNKKPSGILRDDELDYLIYWDYEGFWVFDAKTLRKEVEENLETDKYRKVNWGDGFRSRGMLIPHYVCNQIANKYYDFTNGEIPTKQ